MIKDRDNQSVLVHKVEFSAHYEDIPHPVVRDMAERILVNLRRDAAIKVNPEEGNMLNNGNGVLVDYPNVLNAGAIQAMDPNMVKKLLWDTTFHKLRSKKGPRRIRVQRIISRSKTARLLGKYRRGLVNAPRFGSRGLTIPKVFDQIEY